MKERNSKGKFLPGNPGKPEGAVNKVKQIQREFIQSLLDDQQDKIKTELQKLTGKDYISAVTCLLEFALPKLNRTELTADADGPNDSKIITGMIIM
jgi:hypothetical protein